MILRPTIIVTIAAAALGACATGNPPGTLAELDKVAADIDEVVLGDSLERAAQSYHQYLEETSESALTPEAMRRLADLQIEQEYGDQRGYRRVVRTGIGRENLAGHG